MSIVENSIMKLFMPAAIATGITSYLGLMGCIGGLVGRDGLIGLIGLIVGMVAIWFSYALWTLDTLLLQYWASNSILGFQHGFYVDAFFGFNSLHQPQTSDHSLHLICAKSWQLIGIWSL